VKKLLLPLFLLSLIFIGCLPQTNSNILESQDAVLARQTADIAFHRMEIGKLELGTYSTNVLVDLDLPQGIQWTLVNFGDDSYELRFATAKIPSFAWLVSPAGVRLETVEN